MSVSKKWRSIAAGLFLSLATVGAVSTVSASPARADDVRFGVVVGDHDPYYHDRYGHRRYEDARWRHEYWREREHERREAWRDHQRWERRHDPYYYRRGW